ncbi:uncharacterized protein LOC132945503 [Metopolophium dirhodum]|uniref:uncharacterized protein LOC132945503 n=1 Tax=Metopolophium dirhodum TaxID=44670 RepID=UPI00298FB7D5|nr:uncharacterized protein LOC132945503 [Metopolophium dirhodum]
MKVKRNFTTGILLTIATLMTTTDCVDKKGGPGRLSRARDSIMSVFTMSPNTFLNWKTNSFARNFNKAIGFAPIVKENNIEELLKLISDEADLIKIGAFRKLNKLSGTATTEEKKKKLVLAKLQATIELVKYYGTTWNCPKVKWTLAQGMYYAHSCVKLFGEDKQGECLRKKIQLFTAFMFTYKLEINRFTKFFLNRMNAQANKYLPGDKTLKFINTKTACEMKFFQDNKNIFLRTAMKLYMGSSNKNKNYNCVNELLPFEDDAKEVGSYPGEIHYLIAKAYGYQNNYSKALEHLRKARKTDVVDAKTRETNKKVQAYYEKIYTRINAIGNSK